VQFVLVEPLRIRLSPVIHDGRCGLLTTRDPFSKAVFSVLLTWRAPEELPAA